MEDLVRDEPKDAVGRKDLDLGRPEQSNSSPPKS